jgi:carbonic anhydrase
MSLGTTFSRHFVGIRARHAVLAVTASLVASAALALPEQSPIDITSTNAVYSVLPPLQFDYGNSVALTVENTGSPGEEKTIRANVGAGTHSLLLSGVNYNLLQFHFHTEAEHAVNGVRSEMEMHFVHQATDGSGKLLVVGRFIEAGAFNAALDPIFSALPPTEASPHLDLPTFDLGALLPSDLSSYRYAGSLTTSPYTEGVSWNVLASPATMSHDQIDAFRTLFHEPEGNTRALQSLEGRVVLTDVSGFAVPEPGTWLLMFIGLAAIGGVAAKRRQSA